MNDVVVYYEKLEGKSIRILRVYSQNPVVEIPDRIDGYVVTEIGSYCFSEKNVDISNACLNVSSIPNGYYEYSGLNVLEVALPSSVKKIQDYAFYNCRKLESVRFSKSLSLIGSDVFMNCLCLQTLYYDCSIFDVTILKQILTQITWDIEVVFEDYSIFYPEYNGGYDEVGPAHIFALNIEGEGFRMRQCFKNGKISFDEYDACFEKICAEESNSCIFHVALFRLMMGMDFYGSYIQGHISDFISYIVKNKNRYMIIRKLLDKGFFDVLNLDALILQETDLEIKTKWIELKNMYAPAKNIYSFEDF